MIKEFMIPNCDNQILYISDSEQECADLVSKGNIVAAWLHPGNSECTFSGMKYILENIDELDPEDFEHVYRRLAGLPCDILETSRLLVRESTVDDVDTFVRLYQEPSITQFMEDLFPIDEEKEYQQNYIDRIYNFYDCGIWTIILKATGEIIGRMGVEITDIEGVADMGFMLGKEYQKNGYATEAGLAILEYAFSLPGINIVRARVKEANQDSIDLLSRLGMEYSHDLEEYKVYTI